MKKLAFIFFAVLSFVQLKAQERSLKAVSAGVEIPIPTGGVFTIGIGASGRIEIPLSAHVGLLLTGGIDQIYYKKGIVYALDLPSGAETFVPLKGGIRYFLGPNFFVDGEVGNTIETGYNRRNLFTFAIGPGFTAPITGTKSAIEVGFRYENWSDHDLRFTAFRVAYRFAWR